MRSSERAISARRSRSSCSMSLTVSAATGAAGSARSFAGGPCPSRPRGAGPGVVTGPAMRARGAVRWASNTTAPDTIAATTAASTISISGVSGSPAVGRARLSQSSGLVMPPRDTRLRRSICPYGRPATTGCALRSSSRACEPSVVRVSVRVFKLLIKNRCKCRKSSLTRGRAARVAEGIPRRGRAQGALGRAAVGAHGVVRQFRVEAAPDEQLPGAVARPVVLQGARSAPRAPGTRPPARPRGRAAPGPSRSAPAGSRAAPGPARSAPAPIRSASGGPP